MGKNTTIIPPKESAPETLRVAAYCRVSSDSSDQLHSYAAQIRRYTEEISRHEDWELVVIYADATFIIGLNQQSLETQGVAPV